MSDLHADYLAQRPEVMAFYRSGPMALLNETPTTVEWNPALLEALRRNTENLRASGPVTPLPARGVALVTGQQAGLFLGPLYTIYKAVTALVLSRRIENRFGVPCMPVFWLGSDDHDFEEVRTAHLLDKNHEPLSLRYEPAARVDGLPMFEMPLEDSLRAFIDRAASETTGSEFREVIAAQLRETLSDSHSLADWSARLLGALFKDTELIHFAPHWPEARRLAAPIFLQEIEEPLRSTGLLNEAGARLQALGYAQQVVKAPDECNFFLFVEKRRRKVLYRNGSFVVPEEGLRFSAEELRGLLRKEPERFSANVALRCVVQQKLFGAAAYIAGPGEVAYWAQLKGVFEQFGLAMPVVYPRAQGVLTSLKEKKLMDKFGFTLDDLAAPQDALLDRALRRAVQSKSRDGFTRLREPVEAALAGFAGGLKAGPNAQAMADSLRTRVGEDLDRIERAILLSDRAQAEAVERQVARLCNSLMPWRKPQERVYTVYSFLFEQGPGLIQRLIDEFNVESFGMNEVVL
ncbi:MAG: bacillithiol biosynthesis cysteine-adding enzyme BshC [FCB group bacterium]|jgi:bacillithiol biosynthesis cysteine-adding enzyme BshC|nr:bacillithiol biosynthesis cysteine-adding enzyme BshC [FCB group bacterium]